MNNKNIWYTGAIGLLLSLNGCLDTRTSHPHFDMDSVFNYQNIVPIAVIGSGPAGCSAAIYGARARMHTVIFEGDLPGGLLTQTSLVENWPGASSIMGPEIMSNLKEHAEKVGASFVRETVESIDVNQWPYKLTLSDGTTIFALSVIITTGAAPRRLGVEGEETYWGAGVTSCAVCDAPFFKGEEVVVVGGGDSAVEEAIQLSGFASKITILARKSSLRAAASMQDRLKEYPNITVQYNVEVKKIEGDGSQVTGVQLFNNETKSYSFMPSAGLFLAIGHEPNTALFKNKIKLDNEGYVVLPQCNSQQTSVPGIFAAGDVEDKIYRQAGVSAGRGIQAGLDANSFLTDIGFNRQRAEQLRDRFYGVPTKKEKSTIPTITLKPELDAVVGHNKFVAVAFWQQEDEASAQLMSSFESVADELGEDIAFVQVDYEKATELAKQLAAQSTPLLLIYRNGSLIARYTQAMNKKELYNFMTRITEDDGEVPEGFSSSGL